jgi:copper transport protein
MRRLALLLVLLIGGALLFAGSASAHASVVTSDPRDGSRLKTVPHTVTITFDENVTLGNVGYLHVTDQSGKRVDAGAAYHPNGDGTKVVDKLTRGLGDGSYTESFRIISADSHPVAGTIAFVVGNGALIRGGGVASSTTNHGTSVAFDVSRWISYGGLALLGGVWLLLTIWPEGRDDRRARRIVWAGWTAATLGALLELLVQGPYAAGSGLGKITDGSLLDGTLHTNYGQLHCIRLVLLGLIGLALARSLQPAAQQARWEGGLALVGLAVAWTFSATGHADTTSPNWLSVPVDMAHLLAMAVWVGGLVMLLAAVLPRGEPDELEAVLPTFSATALTAVVVLAASGTYNAWRGIGTINAIFTTTYGLLVVAKIALFVGIVAVANLSRRLVSRRTVAFAMTDAALLEDAPPDVAVDVERLRRSVLVEAGVAVVVLAVTASLGGNRAVSVTADPGTHGRVNVTVALSGGGATKVSATATEQAKQLGPIPIKLKRERSALYDGSADLPVAGDWDIDLVVTTSTFNATTADVTLTLH